MRLFDRITQKTIDASIVLNTSVIPQRYIVVEDWQYNAQDILPKGSILFVDGDGLRVSATQVIQSVVLNMSATIEQSIIQIAQKMALWTVGVELPNPLIPTSVFDHTAQKTKLEEMLGDILDKGHLHHIAYCPYLDIRYEEELVDVSRAKKIANNAHRYLASHSETWQQRSLVGIRPKKILAKLSEDELYIYENRVFVSLLDKLKFYISTRINELFTQQEKLEEALSLGDSSDLYYQLSYSLCTLWENNLTIKETEGIIAQLKHVILYNQELLERVKSLQNSGLYLQIPKSLKKVPDQLHKTNILNHDQHYRHLSRLWAELYSQNKKLPNFLDKFEAFIRFQHSFNQYSLLVILRAFQNLDFDVNRQCIEKSSFDICRGFLKLNLCFDKHMAIWRLSIQSLQLNIVPIANDINQSLVDELTDQSGVLILALGNPNDSIGTHNQIVWVNPYNFYSVEDISVRLLEWLYTPLLANYAQDIDLGRVPSSIGVELNKLPSFQYTGKQYSLLNSLSEKELDHIETVCKDANVEHIFSKILNQHEQLTCFFRCPICTCESEFRERSTNKTFIAKCTNNQCGVEYQLTSNSEKVRTFNLQASGDWIIGGKWSLSFIVD